MSIITHRPILKG